MSVSRTTMDAVAGVRLTRRMETTRTTARPAPAARRTPVDVTTVVLLGATLCTGLMAGLFYAYSVSVMPGLSGASDRTVVETMQRINVAILNGWFGVVLGGAVVLAAGAALLVLRSDDRAPLRWVLLGLGLYVGVLVVTSAASIPLNDRLAAAGDPASIGDLAAVRHAFETGWVRWNLVRTVLCTGAFGALAWALLLRGRDT